MEDMRYVLARLRYYSDGKEMQIKLRQTRFDRESNDFFQNYNCKLNSEDRKAESSKVVTRWTGRKLTQIRVRQKVEEGCSERNT